jgi:hypothetical protein
MRRTFGFFLLTGTLLTVASTTSPTGTTVSGWSQLNEWAIEV